MSSENVFENLRDDQSESGSVASSSGDLRTEEEDELNVRIPAPVAEPDDLIPDTSRGVTP